MNKQENSIVRFEVCVRNYGESNGEFVIVWLKKCARHDILELNSFHSVHIVTDTVLTLPQHPLPRV